MAGSSDARTTSHPPPVPLEIGRREHLGPSPVVALLLAIGVGIAVFALLWKVRKTFGMKE